MPAERRVLRHVERVGYTVCELSLVKWEIKRSKSLVLGAEVTERSAMPQVGAACTRAR